MTETPNPFTNAKLVATNYDSREYIKQSAKRGDKDYVMSRSELMEFSKCPSRWRHGYKENEEGTRPTDWGSLIDCLLFDNDRFNERFAVKPKTYPAPKTHAKVKSGKINEGDPLPWNGNAAYCEDWETCVGQKTAIKSDDQEASLVSIERLYQDDAIKTIMLSSDFQVYCTAEYKDRGTGVIVPVKTLIDIAPKDDRDGMQKAYETDAVYACSLIDFKTGKSANPIFWDREIDNRWYDAQAALFLDVYNAATGEKRVDFYHIVQENYPPYETSFPYVSADFVQLGRDKYLMALRRYAGCLKTNVWPGYDQSYPLTKINGHPCIQPNEYMLRKMP